MASMSPVSATTTVYWRNCSKRFGMIPPAGNAGLRWASYGTSVPPSSLRCAESGTGALRGRLAGFHGVCEDAEAGNGNFDAVTGRERSDAGWRAGEQQVAGLKREDRSDEDEQLGEREDEVERGGVLADFAVETRLEVETGVEVELIADNGADGAEGVEALGARPLIILILQ